MTEIYVSLLHISKIRINRYIYIMKRINALYKYLVFRGCCTLSDDLIVDITSLTRPKAVSLDKEYDSKGNFCSHTFSLVALALYIKVQFSASEEKCSTPDMVIMRIAINNIRLQMFFLTFIVTE